jgi:hypothetical protein
MPNPNTKNKKLKSVRVPSGISKKVIVKKKKVNINVHYVKKYYTVCHMEKDHLK